MFVVTVVLLAIGVVMIYSSSAIYAYEKTGDSLIFLKRHLISLSMGLIGALFFMSFDYKRLKNHSRLIIVLCVVLLLLVFVPPLGREAGGARRWFKLWNLGFQPSELAKLGLIVYMADFLSRKDHSINNVLRTLLPLLMVSGLVIGLILLQPDLGTAVVIASFTMILLFVAGIKWSYLLGLFGVSMPVLYLLICRVPYRWRRIKIFLDPWQDPKGTGFQMIQSFLALGSGGIFGVGLGMSRQKLFYLPEAHTDFIFSIIGEELGLIGTLSITVLFVIFVWQGMRIVFKTVDAFGKFLSLGVVTMMALEILINIGVTIGALPTKGLPLPFISYGGSALFFHMAAVGLLLNIARDDLGTRRVFA